MKLDKAIEILQYHSERNADVAGTSWANAIKLGIAALEEIREERKYEGWTGSRILPGETEE